MFTNSFSLGLNVRMYVEHLAQTLINGKCLTKFDYLLLFLLLFSFCLTWQVTGQTKIQLRINLEGPIFGGIFYDLSRALEIILSIILLSTECFLHSKSRLIAVGAIVLNIEWFNLEILKKKSEVAQSYPSLCDLMCPKPTRLLLK